MSKYPQTLLSCPIAQDGDRSAVPVTALEAGTGRLSQEEGWGKWNSLPIGEGGIPPKRDDFNSVLYLLSSFLVWYQQGGLMNYSATLDYEPGNEVLVGTVKYRCIKANGPSSTVKSPTDQANSAYWSNQDVGEVRYDKAQSLTTSDQARARKNIDVQSTSEVAKQLADAIKGFVAFDKAQSLSNEQKAQARTNIGVTSSGDMNDAIEEAVADVVKHTPQSLNANQQAQARKNIGAISAAEAPAPDLTPYLTKADAASTYLGINAKAKTAGTADTVPWTGVSGKPNLVRSVNGISPGTDGNVTIPIPARMMPNYGSYVQIGAGDYTPSEDGWLRLENMNNGDHTGGKVIHKASGALILEFYQNRYPGNATMMLPVRAGETYTVSNPGKIYFHKMM